MIDAVFREQQDSFSAGNNEYEVTIKYDFFAVYIRFIGTHRESTAIRHRAATS